MKPLCLDLCCGLGGWASGFLLEGWRVLGVDRLDFSARYPGEFLQADLRSWEGWRGCGAQAVVAAPPALRVSSGSRGAGGFGGRLAVWERCERIADKLRVPLVVQNCAGAARCMGAPQLVRGGVHLWGRGLSWCVLGYGLGASGRAVAGSQRADLGIVPVGMARAVARVLGGGNNDSSEGGEAAPLGSFFPSLSISHNCIIETRKGLLPL